MLKYILIFATAIFINQFYNSYTSHQENRKDIVPYAFTENKEGNYEAVVRLYHGNVMCSGVVVSDAYVLTAAHCAVGSTRFMTKDEVQVDSSRSEYTAAKGHFVALDHEKDIALLRGNFHDFKHLPVQFNYNPVYGQGLAVCGFPNNSSLECHVVTFYANYGFQYGVKGAPLQHGQSGGPVLIKIDDAVFVVAVNSAVAADVSVLSPTVGLDGLFGI